MCVCVCVCVCETKVGSLVVHKAAQMGQTNKK